MQVEQIKAPYGQHVLCKRLDQNSKSAGGIELPVEVMYEKSVWCELLMVGHGRTARLYDEEGNLREVHIPATLAKPGDRVLLRQFDGNPISNLDTKHCIAKGHDIQGILSNNPWPEASD
jgi:co-chaperonin GroES (HSP10)